jgi:MFS family permease
MTKPEPLSAAPPTRVRYGVLVLLCALAMITYLDRVCFSNAAPFLVRDLGLTSVADLKWTFVAFAISYSVFEIPAGWLGDRLGPRGTLIRIVAWWSVWTAVTGLVGLQVGGVVLGGLGTMIVVRFLFGAGEAGAFPNITRALHNWFPAGRWAMAQGLVWMSSRITGGLTPLFWAVLVSGTSVNGEQLSGSLMSWRGAFLTFGVIGIAWCVVFALVFRNRPSEHPGVNPAERDLIESGGHPSGGHSGVPWAALFGSRTLAALCLMYASITYGWFFNITYLPTYMDQRYGVTADSVVGAIYKGGPLLAGAVGCLLGGFLSVRLSARLGVRWGRGVLGVTALSLSAACWLAAGWAPDEHWFFVLTSAAAFFNDLIMGAAWASCQDIGRRHAAVVAATMNTAATAAAALAAWMSGYMVERALAAHAAGLGVAADRLSEAEKITGMMPGYHDAFLLYAALYLVAAACWLVIDPNTPIEPDASTPEPHA